MGIQERRQREKKELRQEILDAARELFVKEGFENVSMRKIAEKIEYSPTTIYLYFQDKAELLDCVCEDTLARLDRKLTQIGTTVRDPLQGLESGLRAYIEFGLKHPNHYKVAFMMDEGYKDQCRCERSKAMGQKAFSHLRAGLQACSRQGWLDPNEVETTAQMLWAAAHGLTALLITKQKFPWVERNRLVDSLLGTLVAGIRAGQPVSA